MRDRTIRIHTNIVGSYAQHELSRSEAFFRSVGGLRGLLAIVAVLFAMCAFSAILVVGLLVMVAAKPIGYVPDWMGYGAVMLWAALTLAAMVAVLWRGLGVICYSLIDWAHGRERISPQ